NPVGALVENVISPSSFYPEINPDVTVLSRGNVLVVEQGYQVFSYPGAHISWSQYVLPVIVDDPAGHEVGHRFSVVPFATHPFHPRVAPLAGGGFVMTHESYDTTYTQVPDYLLGGPIYVPTSTYLGTVADVFDASAHFVNSSLVLPGARAGEAIDIAPLHDGGFLAAWITLDSVGNYIIATQNFDGAGTRVGSQANLLTVGHASDISLAAP